jgi:processive 1,2-diacylglycerol beta-glucosyltransferase
MEDITAAESIIVFSSRGGGGHVAATEALKESLGSSFNIEIYNALSDVFSKVDLISRFTKCKITGEDSYNFFLKKRFFFLANIYGIAGLSYMLANKGILVRAAKKFLKEKKPKIVVSVIPYFNGAFQEACQELGIPFWIIPTDLELKTFLAGLDLNALDQDKFKLALAYDPQVVQALRWGIPKEQILKIGFPVKKACVEEYSSLDILRLKDEMKINKGSKVVSLTLGATGTSLFYKILKSLTQLANSNLDFICVAGRDARSLKKAKDFLDEVAICEENSDHKLIYRLSTGSRLHLLGFAINLPQIMAVSDLIISKSGSLSVSEAIHLQKYVLLDHTLNSSSRFLFWERPNLQFVKSLNKGEGFRSKRDLINKVEAFLNQPTTQSQEVFLNIHQHLLPAVQKQVD